jgi:hypothetical protein
MRADYDNEADTIQIELESVDRLDRDEAGITGAIVGILDERPVIVDLLDAREGVNETLALVAQRFGLDIEALAAAAQAALAAPNRVITLDVALPAPA